MKKGIKELKVNGEIEKKIGKNVAGSKLFISSHLSILADLKALMDDNTVDNSLSSLKWKCKSTRKIAEELVKTCNKISIKPVYNLLSEADYTLQKK